MENDILKQAREEINKVDSELAELFEKRMRAVEQIAAFKKEHGIPVLDAAREARVIQDGAARIEDVRIREYYVNFLEELMAVSRAYQQRLNSGMKIAYCGTEGAFAHIASHKLFPEAEKLPFESFSQAYEAVSGGECDAAVLPLENSYAGEVGQVTDLLFSGSLYINGIRELSVRHNLYGLPGSTVEGIRKVISHPQALSQCQPFIKKMGFEEESCESTAHAARRLCESTDKSIAVIASESAGELYKLELLSGGINESGNNTTRFAVVSRAENRAISKEPGAHFVLMFTVRNEAGALARALNIIGAHDFNMRTLRSRPMKELLWQYYFYVEAEGNIHGYEGRCMLEELSVCCDRLKVLGSYTGCREDG